MDEFEPRTEAATGAWYVTFTDIVCLMLTFFVMLYSMSTVTGEKWAQVMASMSQQPHSTNAPATSEPTARYNIATVFRKRAINLDYLHAVLRDGMAEVPQLAKARLHLLDDRLVISLPGDILFAPASAVLDARADQPLFTLGGVLSNLTNPVAVIGHSDRTAPGGAAYASNWELTIGRAAAVANVLRRAGYTRDISVHGAGDSRYDEVSALPADRRDAAARRVDIVILAGEL